MPLIGGKKQNRTRMYFPRLKVENRLEIKDLLSGEGRPVLGQERQADHWGLLASQPFLLGKFWTGERPQLSGKTKGPRDALAGKGTWVPEPDQRVPSGNPHSEKRDVTSTSPLTSTCAL